jgi:RNA polymerase sigma-70 factor (ECF subfamily)
MPQFELAQTGRTDQKAGGSAAGFAEQIIALLPRLSAFAHCLTGNAEQRDDLIHETCTHALAHRDQWQPGTHLECWMFRIAQNLWFDQHRADEFRGEPVDLEMADDPVGSDGRPAAERRLVLADLLRALDQISPEHRALIALVSVCGLTYAEAAEILSLPVGTVMSRLAHGRLALYDAIDGQNACMAIQH